MRQRSGQRLERAYAASNRGRKQLQHLEPFLIARHRFAGGRHARNCDAHIITECVQQAGGHAGRHKEVGTGIHCVHNVLLRQDRPRPHDQIRLCLLHFLNDLQATWCAQRHFSDRETALNKRARQWSRCVHIRHHKHRDDRCPLGGRFQGIKRGIHLSVSWA